MRKDIISLYTWVFTTTIYLAGLSASASQEEAVTQLTAPPVVTRGAPAPGGKGPGMGQGYRQQNPGLGWGGLEYPGGYSSDPEYSPYPYGAVPSNQSYRGRGPGYGRGGRGYGYSYGYPGYRGQGGSGYPRHRQYANPPRYPIMSNPDD